MQFNIFGCELSTDIDVIVLCDSKITKDYIKTIDLEPIETQIRSHYGTERKIDYNFVTVDAKGNVEQLEKGCKETQNMVYYTYDRHYQFCPKIFQNSCTELNFVGKILSISKYVLDKLSSIVSKDEYARNRKERATIYTDFGRRTAFCGKFLLSYDPLSNVDFTKSLVMKIAQCIIIDEMPQFIPIMYSKLGIASCFTVYSENMLYFLTRGTRGTYRDEFISYLVLKLKNITDKYVLSLCSVVPIDIHTTDCKELNEIIISPSTPSAKFIETVGMDMVSSINERYVMKCCGIEHIPDGLTDRCVIVDQRSNRWFEMDVGQSSTKPQPVESIETVGKYIEKYYHLFRGCIVEKYLIENFSDVLMDERYDFLKDTQKIIVGYLKNDDQCVAPDLLLRKDDKIIPVEIKSFVGSYAVSNEYLREYELAQKHIKKAKDILDSFYLFGLIVFAVFCDGCIKIVVYRID